VTDGIWDDGEWISWDSINHHLYLQERQEEFPNANPELIEMFDDLVDSAIRYKEVTGRYLPLFGELGELYAEIKHGITRHRARAQGSDGRLGNDFVEVKTISPEKSNTKVHVKRAGHFSKLLVVRISEDYEFESRMIDRKALQKGQGKKTSVSWSKLPEAERPEAQSD